MKILIILITTFLTMAQAEATSVQLQTQASYEFGVRTDAGYKKITVSIANNGLMTVKGQPLNSSLVDKDLIAHKFVQRRNHLTIKRQIQALSNAKVLESFSEIICLIAVSPEQRINHLSVLRGFNYETHTFEGEMEVIQGPEGCAHHHQIYLEQEYQKDFARELTSTLKVLALEMIGDKLDQSAAVVE